ncbi:MAG TPA: hypothetical protein VGO03_04245 [Acidimicrobiia bacterium]|jgi:hypothetical protein
MKKRARASDALLAGRAMSDGTTARGQVEIERFFGELRNVAEHAPAPRPNAALAAVLDGGRGRLPVFEFADGARAQERETRFATLRRWLRPAIVPSAVAAVLLGGLGGLAGAGALPAPLQHATARVVSHLGVSIPGDTHHTGPAHHAPHTTSPGAHHSATNSPPARSSTPSTTSTHHRTTVTSAPPSASTPTSTPGGTTGGTPGSTPVITVPGTGITVPLPVSPPSVPGVPKIPSITVPTVPNLPPLTVPRLP